LRSFLGLVTLASLMTIASCGGGSGSGSNGGSSSNSGGSKNPTGPNVDAISVNSGPLGQYANGIFTSVTVCAPGSTSNCQTISGVLIDTGSYGLRVLSSALNGLSLPQQKDAATNANPIAECAQFSDGITWGSVRTADVQVAGESASSVPIEVIGDPGFSNVPSSCSGAGKPMDTQQDLLANGIVGIGPFAQDCPACSVATNNPGFYYACPTPSTCAVTTEPIASQVTNPISMFSTDNNGSILELPSIPANGAPSVSGFLVFGIGTQSNNGVGSAKVLRLDDSGNFTTQFQGASYGNTTNTSSFIDSGSNGLFFDNTNTKLSTTCNPKITGFYCPPSTVNLSATQIGRNGTSNMVSFSIVSANTLFSTPNFAFNDLGGPNPGTFDWGLPFFFGRNVITAIAGQSTPAGQGPYWAY
jgi:Protein of unknown function (DUF3443)